MQTDLDVAVVGGGIVGLVSALAAAERGARVAVFDPNPVGGATHAAAGMLSPGAEFLGGDDGTAEIALSSFRGWSELSARVHPTLAFVEQVGSYVTGWSVGDRRETIRFAALADAAGIETQRLRVVPSQLGLHPRFSEAHFFPGDAYVNVDLFLRALLDRLISLGVAFETERIMEARIHSGRAFVSTGASEYLAGQGIIATGYAGGIPGVMAEATNSVRPINGVSLRLRVSDEIESPRMVRAFVDGSQVYVVIRSDGIAIVGASSDESPVRRSDVRAVRDLLDRATQLMPGLEEVEFLEARSGIRPVASNNQPFFEILDTVWAWTSGFYRHGFLFAPWAYDNARKFLA